MQYLCISGTQTETDYNQNCSPWKWEAQLFMNTLAQRRLHTTCVMRILFVKQELRTSITKEKNRKARNQKPLGHSVTQKCWPNFFLPVPMPMPLPCIRDRIKCFCLKTPRPPMRGLLAMFILSQQTCILSQLICPARGLMGMWGDSGPHMG